MINEADLGSEEGWFYELISKKALESLRNNKFDAEYASDRKEALEKVIQRIPSKATIGVGDSVTLQQIGFFSWLESRKDYQVFNPFLRNPEGYFSTTPQERFELMRKALTSDAFLAGTNAVTLDGKLVNIDGKGNRTAAMIFGPRKVILVVGANKIVRDVDDAFRRIKEVCAPINAKRHFEKHHMESMGELPCVKTGVCVNCNSPSKICRKIVIIDGQSPRFRFEEEEGINIIIVGEKLGI